MKRDKDDKKEPVWHLWVIVLAPCVIGLFMVVMFFLKMAALIKYLFQ